MPGAQPRARCVATMHARTATAATGAACDGSSPSTSPARRQQRLGELELAGPGHAFVPHPLQETTLALVGSPAWSHHLRTRSGALHDRRQALAGALHRRLPALLPERLPYGGYHLWLRLPDGRDETAPRARCGRTRQPCTSSRTAIPASTVALAASRIRPRPSRRTSAPITAATTMLVSRRAATVARSLPGWACAHTTRP